MSSIRKLTWLALLIAIGLVIFIIEFIIPRPVPWFKPGFANITTLAALYLFGFPEALAVAIIRVILGSLMIGSLFSPTFILSLGGSFLATIAMACIYHFAPRIFSLIGISVIGAVVHNMAQIILVSLLLVNHIGIFYLLPILTLTSIFTGILIALVTHALLSYIHKHLLAF